MFVSHAALGYVWWVALVAPRAHVGASVGHRVRVSWSCKSLSCGIARVRLSKVLVAWLPPTGMLMPRRRVSCLWNPLSELVVAWHWLGSARAEGIACLKIRCFYG